MLTTGYYLSLPWKVLPTTETVRVIVRLTTPDQRVFEADKDIKVRLVPGAIPKRLEESAPICPPEVGPALVPTGKVTTSYQPAQPPTPVPTPWQAGHPEPDVTLGQPVRGGDR